MGERQMGQREEVLSSEEEEAVGAGTVRMGRWVVVEMGGEVSRAESRREDFSLEEEGFSAVEKVLLLLVLLVEEETLEDFGRVLLVLAAFAEGLAPAMMGGGNSRPSWVFRESWRAKSELCHHSRNFNAKIDVGRRSLRLDRSWG
jgi:hypothetical protein